MILKRAGWELPEPLLWLRFTAPKLRTWRKREVTALPGDPLLLGLCDLHQRQVCPGSLQWPRRAIVAPYFWYHLVPWQALGSPTVCKQKSINTSAEDVGFRCLPGDLPLQGECVLELPPVHPGSCSSLGGWRNEPVRKGDTHIQSYIIYIYIYI